MYTQWRAGEGALRDQPTSSVPPSVAQVQIQAGLEDDHVVKIYDTISLPDKKEMFIVMEYCEGGNLLQWIQRTRRHKLLNQMVRERDEL